MSELLIDSFNPRARVGRDSAPSLLLVKRMKFQSTRPRGARPFSSSTSGASPLFQSTRPRGARQGTYEAFLHQHSFNPRARVGRDAAGWLRLAIWACFNPRARVGRDSGTARRTNVNLVSIHAPAWGATVCYHFPPGAQKRFNPRARVGRDTLTA